MKETTKSELKMGGKWFLIGAAFALFGLFLATLDSMGLIPEIQFNPEVFKDWDFFWVFWILMG